MAIVHATLDVDINAEIFCKVNNIFQYEYAKEILLLLVCNITLYLTENPIIFYGKVLHSLLVLIICINNFRFDPVYII
jgi:hypothetical protein